jgi:hypothetical protein
LTSRREARTKGPREPPSDVRILRARPSEISVLSSWGRRSYALDAYQPRPFRLAPLPAVARAVDHEPACSTTKRGGEGYVSRSATLCMTRISGGMRMRFAISIPQISGGRDVRSSRVPSVHGTSRIAGLRKRLDRGAGAGLNASPGPDGSLDLRRRLHGTAASGVRGVCHSSAQPGAPGQAREHIGPAQPGPP